MQKETQKNLKVTVTERKKRVREESTVIPKIRKQVQENIFRTSIYPEA